MPSGTSTKPRSKLSGRGRMVRLRVDPALTRVEAKQLETRAAEDLRGVGNYVARLVAQDLAKEPKARRRTGARVTDRREAFAAAEEEALRPR